MDILLLGKLSLIEMRTHQVHFSVCQNHPINVHLTPRLQVGVFFVHDCPFCGFLVNLLAVFCSLHNVTSERFFGVAVQNVDAFFEKNQ